MAVKVKKKQGEKSKDVIINFGKSDMVAVELLGRFGKGKVVALHKIAAEQLVKAKTGKIVDVELEEVINNGRLTQQIDGKIHGTAHKDS